MTCPVLTFQVTEELQNLGDYCSRPVDDKREVLLINPHQSEFGDDHGGLQSELSGGPDDAIGVANRKKHVCMKKQETVIRQPKPGMFKG